VLILFYFREGRSYTQLKFDTLIDLGECQAVFGKLLKNEA